MVGKPLLNQAALDSKYRTTAIIFGAQIMMAIMICAVSFVVVPRIATTAESPDVMWLWMVLLFAAVGSFILRRTLTNWERFRDVATLKGIDGVLSVLQRNSIILAAFGEAVVIIGFVIAFVSGNPFDAVRAALIGLVVFGINFPRKGVWTTIVASLEKA